MRASKVRWATRRYSNKTPRPAMTMRESTNAVREVICHWRKMMQVLIIWVFLTSGLGE